MTSTRYPSLKRRVQGVFRNAQNFKLDKVGLFTLRLISCNFHAMKYSRILFMLFLICPIAGVLRAQVPLSSQNKKAIELYNNADNFRVRGQFDQAIRLLEEAIARDKNFEEAYYRMALTYKGMEKPALAVESYERGLSVTQGLMRKKIYWYELTDLLLRQGKYQQALVYADQFLQAEKSDAKKLNYIRLWKTQAEYAIEHEQEVRDYKITPLSDTVNRFPIQYFPVLTADHQQLIFTARFGGTTLENEDLVVSEKNPDGSWSSPVSISENINSPRREGACTISADGRYLIFTICGARGCDLYESRKTGNTWAYPRGLGANINSTFWDSQPSLSADGNELYFSSDRPGGLGGYDIWYSRKTGSGWSRAENLGAPVNTPFDEISPYIHVNNQTLYVVSNGQPGFGGYDIYQVTKTDDGWMTPFNMGQPLNDPGDQYSLAVSNTGRVGYYSKEESKNRSRLYKIEFPEEMVVRSKGNVVKGRVSDASTRAPVGATLELFDLGVHRKISEVTSDSVTGEYLMVLPGGAEYALYVSHPRYLFSSLHFNYRETDDTAPVILNVPLSRIEKNASVILNNLFFDFDQYALKEESLTELEEVVKFLKTHPEIKIEISGHTDNQGKEAYNQQLSLRRANSVADYLKENGIASPRISVKGFGSLQPVKPNDTEENRRQNRRIEFRVQ
jgi:OmpA-OmpF porin, OOP family